MSTIEEVIALLKNGADELTPITGKPTYDDLKRLQEVPRNLLQAVRIPWETDAEGLITSKKNYQSAHAGATFNRLGTQLEAYDPYLDTNTTTTNCMQA